MVKFLGWLTAAAAFAAFSNYVLKLLGRRYLKAVPGRYARQVGWYRSFMRFMVRRHRFFGLAAVVIVPFHAGLVILGSALSVTGGIAALALAAAACLGAYGFYIRKDMRAGWLPLHRGAAFILFLAVVVHIFFKALLIL